MITKDDVGLNVLSPLIFQSRRVLEGFKVELTSHERGEKNGVVVRDRLKLFE